MNNIKTLASHRPLWDFLGVERTSIGCDHAPVKVCNQSEYSRFLFCFLGVPVALKPALSITLQRCALLIAFPLIILIIKEPHNTFGSPSNNVFHICSNAYRTKLFNISINFDSDANFAKSAKTAGRHGNRRTQCPKWLCPCNIHVSYPFGITSTGRGYCYGTSVTMSLTNK